MSQEHDIDRGNDYLWDRSGPVDLEIARLERLLAPYALRRDRQTMDAIAARRRPRRRGWKITLASAAMLAIFAMGIGAWYRQRLLWPEDRPWKMAVIGQARVDGRDARADGTLAPGQVLETGADSSVRLRAARIGEVVVGEGSRFRIVDTRSGRHRTQLQHGSLWARVWAPPGAFGVATPAGDVFDMGCEFTLHANEDGSGSLAVRSGWVQVDNAWREVLVPQGARVEFGTRGQPGTPYDEGASGEFVSALRMLDAQDAAAEPDATALRALIAASRRQDAISLLSLLQARPQLAETPLFDRMSGLMPADARVTRAAVRERGARALGPWWDALPYPRAKRWMTKWPDALPSHADTETLLKR
jgi:hypothetical protein